MFDRDLELRNRRALLPLTLTLVVLLGGLPVGVFALAPQEDQVESTEQVDETGEMESAEADATASGEEAEVEGQPEPDEEADDTDSGLRLQHRSPLAPEVTTLFHQPRAGGLGGTPSRRTPRSSSAEI